MLLGGPLGELIDGVTTAADGMRCLCRPVAQRMAAQRGMAGAAVVDRQGDVPPLQRLRREPPHRQYGQRQRKHLQTRWVF
jgi:hypothetical protein